MASIDKTYCRTWEEYQEVVKWCKENKFTCPNGMIIDPFLSVYEWDQENFDGNPRPIMNTSYALDYYLIKYCPIQLVQDRMREVYSNEYVESIKNGTSEYDTFVRSEPGTKIKMIKNSNFHNKHIFKFYNEYRNKCVTWLMVNVRYNDQSVDYNETYDYFLLPYELGEWESSCADIRCKSIKAVIRRIRKWKLPKGAIVEVSGRYVGEEWIFKIK